VRNQPIPIRAARTQQRAADLLEDLQSRVVGQAEAISQIVPYVRMHRAGLAAEGRPVGVFLLLGPTGTGKTRTVEALAEALHGSERNVLRIDCGEYQLEHEVAKLVGAPPGYLGHRETQPAVSQQKLAAVTSEASNLSLVLFDEIEKAAPSMTSLLLGVLDKATLRLGDNTSVNFERSLIFMTSNLGAETMRKISAPDFGFEALAGGTGATLAKLQKVGMGAVKRRFSPEFVNRIDAVVTYQPLDRKSLELILDQQLDHLNRHNRQRLAEDYFQVEVTAAGRDLLLEKGTSVEFGARELKRTILRMLTQPLAALVEAGQVPPDAVVSADRGREGGGDSLLLTVLN
jgi:ATP-dependent Clp protease ATP-binding subunit ClpA